MKRKKVDYKLTKDESTHSYYVDGTQVPSVTDVLSKKKSTFGGNKYTRFGNTIHSLIKRNIEGNVFNMRDGYHKQFFESFLLFKESYKFEPVDVEGIYYSKRINVAGQVDVVCTIKGEPTIIDWKTSHYTDVNSKEPYGSISRYRRQLCYYKQLIEENYECDEINTLIVYLFANDYVVKNGVKGKI